ncbi:MAG: GAF domain-containing protein, partial [Proteobacteria bacterium]
LERHISDDKAYGGFGGFYEAVREVTSKMMVTENLQDVLELACEELRKLTGFARVLAYKFDGDWNGQVIAESRDEVTESLLHHHFPASDIPKQARDLYTSNWLRLIPNADYKPAKIIPEINPITDQPLDLSNSVLRSVSPVHLEYMRNMGQAASMSVSLLKGKQLWGLISCHNPVPHYLKYDVRVASEFVGQMVSAQIVAREESSENDHKLQLKKLYDDLLKNGGSYNAIKGSIESNAATMLGLADSSGAALLIDGELTLLGRAADPSIVREFLNWVAEQREPMISTQRIEPPKELGLEKTYICGVLAISIPRENGTDVVAWFRPEERERQKWAGDPSAEKQVGADGKIHPRASFATWYEQNNGTARKWLRTELAAADELRRVLIAMSISATATPPDRFRASLSKSIAHNVDRESKQTQQNLDAQQTETFREAALDSRLLLEGFSEFAVLFLDLKGSVQNWSLGAKRLLGYESSAVLGKSVAYFFSEEDELNQKVNQILEAVQTHGRSENELWLYRDDGSSFWGKLLAATVNSENGVTIGYSVVLQDVTKEKSAEEELKAMKFSAETANKAKTAFLANISHEIRTPLTLVMGPIDVLADQYAGDPFVRKQVSIMRGSTDRLLRLLNQLLDFRKHETGNIQLQWRRTDLAAFLSNITDSFREHAHSRQITLTNESDVSALPTWFDAGEFEKVIYNLLLNAVKFTPAGGT